MTIVFGIYSLLLVLFMIISFLISFKENPKSIFGAYLLIPVFTYILVTLKR